MLHWGTEASPKKCSREGNPLEKGRIRKPCSSVGVSTVIVTWTRWFAAPVIRCHPFKGTRLWWNTSGAQADLGVSKSQWHPFLLWWAREPVLVPPEGCQAHPLGCVSCGHVPTQRCRFPAASFCPKLRRVLQSLGRDGPHGSQCRLCRRAWVQVSFAVHRAAHCSDSRRCCPQPGLPS